MRLPPEVSHADDDDPDRASHKRLRRNNEAEGAVAHLERPSASWSKWTIPAGVRRR